jgi:hypothetical protein
LVIIFIGRVLLTPSVSYENEILVDKSVKESWAVMSDELTMPKWIKGFQRSELVSGTKKYCGCSFQSVYRGEWTGNGHAGNH